MNVLLAPTTNRGRYKVRQGELQATEVPTTRLQQQVSQQVALPFNTSGSTYKQLYFGNCLTGLREKPRITTARTLVYWSNVETGTSRTGPEIWEIIELVQNKFQRLHFVKTIRILQVYYLQNIQISQFQLNVCCAGNAEPYYPAILWLRFIEHFPSSWKINLFLG
jgi:hypothetical protein